MIKDKIYLVGCNIFSVFFCHACSKTLDTIEPMLELFPF